ncbi:hypothetical protein PR048_028383 [Dryococelus australis]|uniref:Uncharacterized protein n=1 Tax=Dryococelus australis TaxID=614101 RepID=A0ABQ9GJ39_9NEOP|nr:hypothetical protein PR048_028383 [Dryococelus australis]
MLHNVRQKHNEDVQTFADRCFKLCEKEAEKRLLEAFTHRLHGNIGQQLRYKIPQTMDEAERMAIALEVTEAHQECKTKFDDPQRRRKVYNIVSQQTMAKILSLTSVLEEVITYVTMVRMIAVRVERVYREQMFWARDQRMPKFGNHTTSPRAKGITGDSLQIAGTQYVKLLVNGHCYPYWFLVCASELPFEGMHEEQRKQAESLANSELGTGSVNGSQYNEVEMIQHTILPPKLETVIDVALHTVGWDADSKLFLIEPTLTNVLDIRVARTI